MDASSWIKKIPSGLLLQESVPLPFNTQKFTLKDVEKQLNAILQLPQPIRLRADLLEWKEASSQLSDLANPLISSFAIPSFPATVQLAMAKNDVNKVLAHLLSDNQETVEGLDKETLIGFFQFLSLRIAQTLLDLGLGYPLQLCDEPALPNEPTACIDITATLFADHSVVARVALPQSFYIAWSKKQIQDPIQQMSRSPLSETIDLPLHIEVGRLRLSQEEWDTLKPGDLILFPKCGVDPETLQGHVYLTLYNEPVFEGSFDGKTVSITKEPTHIEDQYMRKK